MAKREHIPAHLKPWIEARRRFRLSHMHIQMARELGMNPKRFGKLDNHRQEPWKAPLPIFIERIYFKRFGKEKPDEVLTIRQFAERQQAKKRAKKLGRLARKAAKPQGHGALHLQFRSGLRTCCIRQAIRLSRAILSRMAAAM